MLHYIYNNVASSLLQTQLHLTLRRITRLKMAYSSIYDLVTSLYVAASTAALMFLMISVNCDIDYDEDVRYCYECTGFQCMHNPQDLNLFPGRVRCHPVMDFCTTHVRYTPTNRSLARNKSLTVADYMVTSATRSCAKTWLGNTCRRDWLGRPDITCITTCSTDFCNCDTRSPPPEMFRNGQVLPLAPNRSTYNERDTVSCRHMDGVPGYVDGGRYKSQRIDDDYTDYQLAQQKRETRRRKHGGSKRRNSASRLLIGRATGAPRVGLLAAVVHMILHVTIK